MRTKVEENKKFAELMSKNLNNSSSLMRILLPTKHVSALGKPFYDPQEISTIINDQILEAREASCNISLELRIE